MKIPDIWNDIIILYYISFITIVDDMCAYYLLYFTRLINIDKEEKRES